MTAVSREKLSLNAISEDIITNIASIKVERRQQPENILLLNYFLWKYSHVQCNFLSKMTAIARKKLF